MLAQLDVVFKEQIEGDFKGLAESLNFENPGYLTSIREVAFSYFQEHGFPTLRNEDWKYTPVKPYLKESFVFDSKKDSVDFNPEDEAYFAKKIEGYKIYIIDGEIDTGLSTLPDPAVCDFQPITEVLEKPVVKDRLSLPRNYKANPFLALNTALFSKGVFIEVFENVKLDQPIHLIHVSTGKVNLFDISKNVFVAREGSEAEIVESYYHADTDQVTFRNSSTEILVESHADLEHIKLQKSTAQYRMVEHTEVEQLPESLYNNYTFTLPGMQFVRNNLNFDLNGSDIESHMYGLYLTSSNQLVDNHTLVNHQQPDCESNQLYKGIMTDRSRAVFNGKVYVHSIAQKTNAFQQNNNIVVSDDATIYSKPQLEIFADDVKCSHGSTIGQLDQNALFYLRSRGLGKKEAESILFNAFAFDVTGKLKDENIRALLDQEITDTVSAVIS